MTTPNSIRKRDSGIIRNDWGSSRVFVTRRLHVSHRVAHFGIDSGVHRQPECKQWRPRLSSFTTPESLSSHTTVIPILGRTVIFPIAASFSCHAHRVAPHICDQVGRPLLDRGAGGRSPRFQPKVTK